MGNLRCAISAVNERFDKTEFHFYFLFRNNGIRDQLYQNDFCCCYGEIFFESVIAQVLDHSYVQSSFSTITRHLDNGI